MHEQGHGDSSNSTPTQVSTRRRASPNMGKGRLLKRALAAALVLSPSLGCTNVGNYFHNCFKVGPNYERPSAPVANDWIDADDKRISTADNDLREWWKVFNDPVLNALVARAYQQNLTLREAGFRVLEARARRGIAVGNLFPQTQEAFGGYDRYKISGASTLSSYTREEFFSVWSGGFNLAWELDFWGRFRRAVEAADADLDASVEFYDQVLVTLIGDVATTYIQIRTLEQRIRFARDNVVLQGENLKIAQAKFSAGQTTQVDVDQAKSDLGQTQASIPPLQVSLREAQNQLCILLGEPPHQLNLELGAGPIPKSPPQAIVGIPGDLLRRRPDVRHAERLLAGQSARIGIATAELYPHIAITGTIGVEADRVKDLFTEKAMIGSIGPSLQWNILNYGRLLNNIRMQDARFGEFLAHYQQTVLNANAEVENGLIGFLKSAEQARYLQEAAKASADGVKIAMVNYENGKIPFTAVVIFQQNLVQQQDQLAQALGNIPGSLVQVYRALGGGWQLRLEDPAILAADENVTPPPPSPTTQPDVLLPNTVPLRPSAPMP
ncbi:MAG: efflux transporter outer membrane subunit [Planctomycetota bacterium]